MPGTLMPRAIVNADCGLKMMEQIHQLVSEIKSGEDRSLSIHQAASNVAGTQVGGRIPADLRNRCAGLHYIWRSFAELTAAHDQLAVANLRAARPHRVRCQSSSRDPEGQIDSRTHEFPRISIMNGKLLSSDCPIARDRSWPRWRRSTPSLRRNCLESPIDSWPCRACFS
jgi:hypothetical protein